MANSQVHERLYSSNKDPNAKSIRTSRKGESEPKLDFVPQINEKSKKIQRDVKVEEYLLDDAKRRR